MKGLSILSNIAIIMIEFYQSSKWVSLLPVMGNTGLFISFYENTITPSLCYGIVSEVKKLRLIYNYKKATLMVCLKNLSYNPRGFSIFDVISFI